MKKQAYTLAEVLVTAFIMSVVLSFLAMVLWVGDQTYKRNMGLIDLHVQARRVMDGMTREIRKSRRSDIFIPSNSYAEPSIQFTVPFNVTINGTSSTVNNATVHYYLLNADHTIRRVSGGSNRVIATNIDTNNGLAFCWSTGNSTCPCTTNPTTLKTVRIEMRGNQTMRGGGSLIFSTTEQVRLRNE